MSPRKSSRLTVEHILLYLIDQRPMHGYELYQELCAMEGISLIWNIKQALLYANLEKLEGQGFLKSDLVQGEAYPPRRYFRLTDSGKNSLQAWLNSPVRRARDLRQEFLAKLIIARRYGTQQALDLIQVQEKACERWLHDLKATIEPPQKENFDAWLVYSFRIKRLEMILEWLKTYREEVNRAFTYPEE
jgi:PadR family transcriptional regulator, regulatory protein AphA